MFSTLTFNLVTGYAEPYDIARTTYLDAASALKLATGPYKVILHFESLARCCLL